MEPSTEHNGTASGAAAWASRAPACALLLALVGCAANDPAPAAPPDHAVVSALRAEALPITGAADDYDALLERIGGARVVLIGESTHGTHEFYRARAEITRRLIAEHGFSAVAIEGDWPDAERVDRYVRGGSADRSAAAALADFDQFPTWMWRNTDVREFVDWLREHNASLPAERRAGFYGLDLYSLFPSIEAVTGYLDRAYPDAGRRARERYRCFERFDDPVAYGQAVELGRTPSCAGPVEEQLRELERWRPQAPDSAGRAAAEAERFAALRNARAVQGAEEYYRSMFVRGVSTWNLRDRYMMETLEALVEELERRGTAGRVVVWAHNSHVGDARATHMGDQGEINLGQLARQRWGDQAALVGFTTYTGTVRAASDWGGASERKRVRPALPESYEWLFHEAGAGDFLLLLDQGPASRALAGPRLERAIGVIYLPQSERVSHYFHAVLPAQFDAVLHFDRTRAVEPLDRGSAGSPAGEHSSPTRG